MKGVIYLPATGYLQVRVYASYAQIPLQDATVTVSAGDGTVIALRITDRSGQIPIIEIPVPDKSNSLSPNPPEIPFTTVNLTVRIQGYEQIFADNIQIFAGVTTAQNFELIPLSELPDSLNKYEQFDTPPQNL